MDNEKQTLTGTIVFLKANVGSKSESVQPMLYRGKDELPLPLYRSGDNPFENTGLAPYDGQAVELTGAMERGKFVIEQIRVQEGRARTLSAPYPVGGEDR